MSGLTIIGGTLKGKRLFSPKGMGVRPTSGRVREALFNILMNEIEGAIVADLFAGTGAMAIEALSRGAARAVLIDNHPASLAVIEKNLAACRLQAAATLIRYDATRDLACLKSSGLRFDLVFMDPPYKSGATGRVLANLHACGVLAPGAWVAAEHPDRPPLDDGEWNRLPFTLAGRRRYGKTLVSFFRYMIENPEDDGTTPLLLP
ncbi:MAG: 16S rRNA (guanine(966)-N(2))-methyltransferase RsmD [Thermodesulfobacteriota bacterium]